MTPEKIAQLKTEILYNPDKGTFTRRTKWQDPVYMKPNNTGAPRVLVSGKEYSARNLAWALSTGEYPGRWELKSLDGDLTNVKLNNLYRVKPNHKFCARCNQEKPISEYIFRDAQKYIRRPECRTCRAEINKKQAHIYNLKGYGLTAEQYGTLCLEQNNGCAICGGTDKNRRLSVDHCHTTSKVRGLLCSKCNQGIGMFKDSPELLSKAITYLST